MAKDCAAAVVEDMYTESIASWSGWLGYNTGLTSLQAVLEVQCFIDVSMFYILFKKKNIYPQRAFIRPDICRSVFWRSDTLVPLCFTYSYIACVMCQSHFTRLSSMLIYGDFNNVN